MSYNGWRNYETWNISLWIGSDEGLYNLARECCTDADPYATFCEMLRELGVIETPDHVAYNDSGLDRDSINDMMRELGA